MSSSPSPAPKKRNEWDIFISYRRSPTAEKLAKWLQKELEREPVESTTGQIFHLDVFVDVTEPHHANFQRNLVPILQHSRALIVLADAESAKRKDGEDYLYEELDWWAKVRWKTPFIVVQLDSESGKKLLRDPQFQKWKGKVNCQDCFLERWKTESDGGLSEKSLLLKKLRESVRNYGQIIHHEEVRKFKRIALVASIMGIAALIAAGFWWWQKGEADKQRVIAQKKERLAKLAQVESERQELLSLISERSAIWAERDATAQRNIAEAKQREAERRAYHSQIIAANELVRKDRMDEARRLLFGTPPQFRDWEWGYLMQLCGPHSQNLADFASRKLGDRTPLMTLLLGQIIPAKAGPRRGVGPPPRLVQSSRDSSNPPRIKDWEHRNGSNNGSLISYWDASGGRQGTSAYVTRRNLDTRLLSVWTILYGGIDALSFAKDASLMLIDASSFRTNFGEVISTDNDDVFVLGVPDRFDLSKLRPPQKLTLADKQWFAQYGRVAPLPFEITFSNPERVIVRWESDRDGEPNKKELVLEKDAEGFQSRPVKTIKIDQVETIPAESKKVWRSKLAALGDDVGRALGDDFEMDGRDCVTLIKSNDTVEIWSVLGATLKFSFGIPNRKPCVHKILALGREGTYDHMERQPGGCLLAAASTVNITAARIFACPIAGGGTVYDLKLRNKICDLLDPHGKAVALGAIDPAAWLDITAQIDPRGEFIGVRQVGRNEDGFGIWRADTGRPIYLSGDLAAKVSTKKRKRAEWGEKNVPGVVGVTGVGWTADGGWVVVIDQEGAVFVKNHLLSADAHKIRGALLSDVLDHTDVHGHWSPVKFPVRVLSKERLLIGNYVIDTETWTVLVELPKAAEIAPDNSVVATWTNTGDLELCDMSFWRAYKGGASESLRLREQLLQWQIGESDKSVAASGSVH